MSNEQTMEFINEEDNQTNEDSSGETPDKQDNQKTLYAGKFDSIEALEEGYKNAARVYQENDKLKKQVETISQAPDEYLVPEQIGLGESELNRIKSEAKDAKLTQDQFVTLANNRALHKLEKTGIIERSREALGDSGYNMVNDYINKTIPESLRGVVLDSVMTNEVARTEILSARQQALNSKVSTMSHASSSGNVPRVTDKDVRDAYNHLNSPDRALSAQEQKDARSNYIELMRKRAHEEK